MRSEIKSVIVLETSDDYAEFTKQLVDKGYTFYKVSWTRGYVSRQIAGKATRYSGIYGNGYMIDRPNWQSTNYTPREYWVK